MWQGCRGGSGGSGRAVGLLGGGDFSGQKVVSRRRERYEQDTDEERGNKNSSGTNIKKVLPASPETLFISVCL